MIKWWLAALALALGATPALAAEPVNRYPAPGKETRNFAYDAYAGIRVGDKRAWFPSLETSSVEATIAHESRTQLYVRLTTKNFEEAIRARKEKRAPVFKD